MIDLPVSIELIVKTYPAMATEHAYIRVNEEKSTSHGRTLFSTTSMVFTARRYASAVLAVVIHCPSVRLSICPSVTRRYCIKKATRITQAMLHDSPGALVF